MNATPIPAPYDRVVANLQRILRDCTIEQINQALSVVPRSGRVVGYLHADGQRFMAPEVFDAWRALHATPEQAAQYGPVVRPGR